MQSDSDSIHARSHCRSANCVHAPIMTPNAFTSSQIAIKNTSCSAKTRRSFGIVRKVVIMKSEPVCFRASNTATMNVYVRETSTNTYTQTHTRTHRERESQCFHSLTHTHTLAP